MRNHRQPTPVEETVIHQLSSKSSIQWTNYNVTIRNLESSQKSRGLIGVTERRGPSWARVVEGRGGWGDTKWKKP